MLQTGKVIQDRYRIVAPLGQGGMGAVYRAWDLRLKVPVALKELKPQPGLDESMLGGLRVQFEQEASTLARLNHPNLVRVTDFFEEEGNAYLVMDFVDGQSLADVIAKEGAQTESRVLGWAEQLLDALRYCHNEGVIHRDIKPQNIIVRQDRRVMLVDFGLVKLWDPNDPRTRTVMRGMGTPEYAPPEQYGATVDHTGPPSDLYSLGATLYHALTGQVPPTATERMAIPEQFVPLRRLAPHVSTRTENLVMRSLALSVAERWQSAGEMLAALHSGPLNTVSPSQPSAITPTRVVEPSAPPAQPPPTMQPITGGAGGPITGPPPASQPKRKTKLWIGLTAAAVFCLAVSCVGVLVVWPAIRDRDLPSDELPITPVDVTSTVEEPPTWLEDPTATPETVTPEPLTSTPVAATATPRPVTGGNNNNGGDGQIQVVLDNRSYYALCHVYISPTDSTEWGEDWLEADQVIDSNTSQTFDVPSGVYDLMVRDCLDEAIIFTAWDFSGDQTFQIGGVGLVPIQVINEVDVDICYVYISPPTSDTWGEDWLSDTEVIPPGEARAFFVEPGTYDMLVNDCDENALGEIYDFDAAVEYWFVDGSEPDF